MRIILYNFLFMIMLAVSMTSYAQVWTNIYNGPSGREDVSTATVVDRDGNVFVTGCSYDDVTGFDYLTIKYSPSGEQLWINRYSSPGNQEDKAFGIIADGEGSTYITGFTTSPETGTDITTVKYSASGIRIWVATFNSSGNTSEDKAFGLAQDQLGFIYVTGYSSIPSNGNDVRLIKYHSETGSMIWTTIYNGPGAGDDRAFGIAVDDANKIIVVGHSKGNNSTGYSQDYITIKYFPDGTMNWQKRYNGPDSGDDMAFGIAVDDNDNIVVTGRSMQRASGNQGMTNDFATLKYDKTGNLLWEARYNGEADADDEAFAVAVNNSNEVIIAGVSTRPGRGKDITTVKYNAAGIRQWVSYFGGSANEDDSASAIAVFLGNGDIFVAGHTLNASLVPNFTTVRYNNNGEEVQSVIYPVRSSCNDIAVDQQEGSLHVAGFVQGFMEDYITFKFARDEMILIGIEAEGFSIPEGFSLHQNYPNPFNPVTSIKFTLPEPLSVSLTVYDMLGRAVATLVNEGLKAGTYRIVFNAGDLASGTYFFKLSAGDFKEIKKMTLIK